MKTVTWFLLASLALGACAGSATTAPTEGHAASVKPDLGKLRTHTSRHIQYPATRAQVLAACADTPEFTAEEKQWVSDRLPEGTYNSDAELLAALGL